MATGILAAKPGIDDFFPDPILFEGTIFQMNRMVLIRIIATLALVLIFSIGAARAKIIPSKGQQLLEMPLLFVRDFVAVNNLGPNTGRKYAPLLTIIFLGVLFMNITGVIPGLNIAASSVVAVPIVFAVLSYIMFIGAGIKAQGVGKFFKSQLFPPGVPWPLYIILTPIEAFSTFIVRPATLVIRLLANMLAGHMMMAICFFGTHYLFFQATGFVKAAGALTLAGSIMFVAFEIFVAGLQAFIFTILTTVYIKMSVQSH
ncbi:F0F1 ATP synthase subunit A [Gleimia hominis]|uniref:ATP synthase subunit a n=1 Tax=Gleimia hominis TaxID=595468 RepID=A0ABU3IAM5_9ACTO|nr:F0F1 ATP synthase subunit A [Gleimia hominis]MDT3767401.1 F0F1 ATP synthase subunit A [Gleimia hominis]